MSSRLPLYVVLFTALLALVLPLATRLGVGTDFSEHVVLLDVLMRLVRGDAATSEVFELSVQPLNYHLFYLVGTLLALAIGSSLACRTLMVATGFALVWRTARALRGTAAIVLALPVTSIYLGALFRWGFVPNVVAMALGGIVLVELVDFDDVPAWRPALLSVAAVATHVMLYPAIVITTLAAWVCRLPSARAAQWSLGASSAFALPGLVWTAMLERNGAGAHKHVDFNDLTESWWSLVNFVSDGDSLLASRASLGIAALLILCGLSAWPRRPRLPWGPERKSWMLLVVAVATLTLLRLCPSSSPGSISTSVQLEWRCLAQGELALLLLAARSAWWQRRLGAWALGLVSILAPLAHAVGLLLIGLELDQQMFPWPNVPLSPRARIAIVQQEMHLSQAKAPAGQPRAPSHWYSPLAQHNPRTGALLQRVHAVLWALPQQGALWGDEQFVGNHVPIRLRDPTLFVRSQSEARQLTASITWRAYIDEPKAFDDPQFPGTAPRPITSSASSAWRTFDVLWWESPHIDLLLEHLGEDARLLARGWDWAALVPPLAKK